MDCTCTGCEYLNIDEKKQNEIYRKTKTNTVFVLEKIGGIMDKLSLIGISSFYDRHKQFNKDLQILKDALNNATTIGTFVLHKDNIKKLLARQLLFLEMRDWSEEIYCSGWYSGVENCFEQEELYQELVKLAGGTWTWMDGADAPLFVELEK